MMSDSNRYYMQPISTDKFRYSKRKFTAEMSSLRGHNLFSLIYKDAVDAGFEMQNPKTNGKKIFFHYETVYDQDGDITCWKFLSNDKIGDELEAIVFND